MTLPREFGYYEYNLDLLVDETIVQAFLNEGYIYLSLDTGRNIALVPEGDCCANCYINGINFSEQLLGTIISVDELDGGQEIEKTESGYEGNHIDIWGHRIHTTQGFCTIDMRTEHNGYYSGRLLMKDAKIIPVGAKPLEDFSG